MQMLRQIYESVPNVIPVPAALHRRRVEVIMLPLDEVERSPVLSDEAQQQALQQLMHHAGAVQSGNPNAGDNEQSVGETRTNFAARAKQGDWQQAQEILAKAPNYEPDADDHH